ncbi:MAG TPA: hypothetical protein VFB76_00570 [Candidatus Angelobacter sp.]|nr:hypothetical protein [Candidatus Angelobacter sp.]
MRCLSALIVLAMPMFQWLSTAAVTQEANPRLLPADLYRYR